MQVSLDHRRGMTLVELLVVVAIVGLLAVTVLPNIANTAEARRSREAARMVSSFVAKAQSRAIGRREWAGFTMSTMNASSYATVDLSLADVPSVYRGDTVPATLMITGSASPTVRIATGIQGQLTFSGSNIRAFDLIRFGGNGPWYEISETPDATSIRFRIRGDLAGGAAGEMELSGATRHNTPWPPFSAPLGTGSNPLTFEIMRHAAGIGSPLSLSDGRCVDLYWSGYGPPSVGGAVAYRRFELESTGTATAGITAAMLFDGTGRTRQLQFQLGSTLVRRAVTGPIYLLVGRTDRVITNPNNSNDPNQPQNLKSADDSTGANWQYPDSWWVAVDPMTGVAKAAECVPNATSVTESQAWVRESLLGTGR
jgi:prepilin-type N-terminal cleavage/methylation domain-containing protein